MPQQLHLGALMRPVEVTPAGRLPLDAQVSYVYPSCISLLGRCIDQFYRNRSQAVRLPKAVAFPQDVHRVDILKLGRSLLIVPQGRRWDDLFLAGPRLTADFMTEREQPAAEMRDPV